MILFTLSIFLAWIMRDYAQPMMKKIPWIAHMGIKPSDEWFGKQAVYRISFGSFMFFAMFSVLLLGVKYKGEARAKMHTGGWFLKLTTWLLFVIVPFFLPNESMVVYSWFSRFGSSLFLILQMMILLDFTHAWNDSWVNKEHNGWVAALLTLTTSSYALCIAGVVVMYQYFNPSGADCDRNVWFITLTLIMFVAFSVISLLPQVQHGSLFPSAVIALYTVFLCFSAMDSQPATDACNGMGDSRVPMAWGMAFTLVSVGYSAMRAGSSSDSFTLTDETTPLSAMTKPLSMAMDRDGGNNDEEAGSSGDNHEEFEPIPYSYSFFHFVFALASMYTSMVMTSWGSPSPQEGKDTIDVGWASYWVKLTSMAVMGLLYTWTLVAPLVLKDREF